MATERISPIGAKRGIEVAEREQVCSDLPMSESSPHGLGSVVRSVLTIDHDQVTRRDDRVAAESPVEIRVASGGRQHAIAVTMRTPGHDHDLAAGFLLTEGVLADGNQIMQIDSATTQDETTGAPPSNVVCVTLHDDVAFDPEQFRRNVYTGSSCGICGRASIDRVAVTRAGPPEGETALTTTILHALPATLRAAQDVFTDTGGLHAAGLFDPRGRLLLLREDVGRHNAVDKIIGARLRAGALPASDTVLVVSGRASYELVQKALVAGIPTLAAVGAPSSLAVDLARRFELTLIGFLRDGRFNLYTAPKRVAL